MSEGMSKIEKDTLSFAITCSRHLHILLTCVTSSSMHQFWKNGTFARRRTRKWLVVYRRTSCAAKEAPQETESGQSQLKRVKDYVPLGTVLAS